MSIDSIKKLFMVHGLCSLPGLFFFFPSFFYPQLSIIVSKGIEIFGKGLEVVAKDEHSFTLWLGILIPKYMF